MANLNGRTALVTGGASGIGQAACLLYAEQQCNIVISDIQEGPGNQLVDRIKSSGGKAVFVKSDVSDPESCKRLVDLAVQEFGSLDIAFNNAGISGESNPVGDMSVQGWNQMISVNLNSVFYCMKYELLQMQKEGKGVIVNNSSILGAVAFANACGYVSAKHGVIGLTQTAALEYSSKGIRINAIGPGFINTPLLTTAGMTDEVKSGLLVPMHPIGRLGNANEVAELVIWLSSDSASFITGAYYPVDGGYLCK